MLSLGRLCSPRSSKKGKKAIECSIENFVPVVAVTKQKDAPSIEFSTAKGNFEREKVVEGTMLSQINALNILSKLQKLPSLLMSRPPTLRTRYTCDSLFVLAGMTRLSVRQYHMR